MSRVRAVLQLARPPFLLGGVVLHGLGVSLALAEGARLDPRALLWGQLTITVSQLVTHFSNEHFDQHADVLHHAARRPRWSGGSGVLPAGVLPTGIALRAALVALLVAVASATVIVASVRPGPVSLVLLSGAILLAWSYSSPPLALHGTGAGEVLGALLLAAITPLLGYHLHGGMHLGATTLRLLPLVALQLAMLITVSLPDRQGDAAAGKRTLAVRVGPVRAARLGVGAMATAYVLALLLLADGVLRPAPAGAYAAWIPLALWQARELLTGAGQDPRRWDRLAFGAIALVMGSALTLAVASLTA